MKRSITIKVRLSEKELAHLNELVSASKLSRESYIRMLIKGVIPKPAPSAELIETTKLLRSIANNINQIARIANSNGDIHTEDYKDNYITLNSQINEIMYLIRDPYPMNTE